MVNKNKDKNEINKGEINETVGLLKRILKLLYIVMIVAGIFIITLIAQKWGILGFILSLLKVMSPLFIGFAIAWLFNPAVEKMERKGLPRFAGTMIVYLILIVFLIIFFKLFIPTMYDQINELIKSIPNIIKNLEDILDKTLTKMESPNIDISSIKDNILNTLGTFTTNFTGTLPAKILDIILGLISGLGTLVFGLVVGLYMLLDFEAIKKQFVKYIPIKYRHEASTLIGNIGSEVRKSINGTLLVAFAVFIGDFLGFAVVGLQGALIFALFCGLTDLIPYIGPYIGGAAAVVVGFSTSTPTGIAVLAIVIIVQLLENFVLQPVIMSKTMKLNPVTIIIGLLIFNHFFGIVGMILATPTIALLKVIYEFIAMKYNFFGENELKES
ncbi:MAG: AI-2E family transporter [Bacilli bacterium]|nr:AI-2E family transporter [Bacilli bacterium]